MATKLAGSSSTESYFHVVSPVKPLTSYNLRITGNLDKTLNITVHPHSTAQLQGNTRASRARMSHATCFHVRISAVWVATCTNQQALLFLLSKQWLQGDGAA